MIPNKHTVDYVNSTLVGAITVEEEWSFKEILSSYKPSWSNKWFKYLFLLAP